MQSTAYAQLRGIIIKKIVCKFVEVKTRNAASLLVANMFVLLQGTHAVHARSYIRACNQLVESFTL